MQGFGVLYYKISAMFVIDGFSEARLYLLCDVEIVEDGHLACVQFHDVGFVGRNHRYIVFHLVVDRLVVYIDVLVSGVEQVSYQGHCSSCFLKDKLWALLCFLNLCECFFPTLVENFHLHVQFGNSLAFSHGAHNDAAVFRLYAVYELLKACSLFAALNFA